MTELIPIISSFVLFAGIMAIFTQEKMDYLAYSLLAAILACLINSYFFGTTFLEYLKYIEFEPLIFILSMQIIIKFVEEQNIFQWLALKILVLTHSNHRQFFYLICIASTLTAAFLADITVTMIFVPLIIRATKILKINPTPYLFGFIFTIVIGSAYTPFSSSENILIAHAFALDFIWFMSKLSVVVLINLIITLVLIDLFYLRKNPPPNDYQKKILLEIMNPAYVIVNKKKFILNSILFSGIIIGLILIESVYIVAAMGAIIMSLLNKSQISKSFSTVDWKILFFFVSLFLLIGTMEINGTFEYIGNWVGDLISGNLLVGAIIILLLTAVLSGILANVPTTIVFINLISTVFGTQTSDLIYIAFLLGVNFGANLLPQGCASSLMALNFAKTHKISDFSYKSALKNGLIFTGVHIVLSMLYLGIYFLLFH